MEVCCVLWIVTMFILILLHLTLVYGRSLRQFSDSVSIIDFNDPDFKLYSKFLNVMALKE